MHKSKQPPPKKRVACVYEPDEGILHLAVEGGIFNLGIDEEKKATANQCRIIDVQIPVLSLKVLGKFAHQRRANMAHVRAFFLFILILIFLFFRDGKWRDKIKRITAEVQ